MNTQTKNETWLHLNAKRSLIRRDTMGNLFWKDNRSKQEISLVLFASKRVDRKEVGPFYSFLFLRLASSDKKGIFRALKIFQSEIDVAAMQNLLCLFGAWNKETITKVKARYCTNINRFNKKKRENEWTNENGDSRRTSVCVCVREIAIVL